MAKFKTGNLLITQISSKFKIIKIVENTYTQFYTLLNLEDNKEYHLPIDHVNKYYRLALKEILKKL